MDGAGPVTPVTSLPAVARGNLTDRVQHLLRERILSGEWPAGTRLPRIEQLAADTGVSRTVAREAVKALATQGLLEVVHGYGTMVAASTNRPVVEALRHGMRARPDLVGIVEVRLALEVEAAALAAERRTEADLAVLREAAERMRALRRTNGSHGFIQADVAFHEAVVRATHNPVFAMVAESIAELLEQTRHAIARSEVPSLASTAAMSAETPASGSEDGKRPEGSKRPGQPGQPGQSEPAERLPEEAHSAILSHIEERDAAGAAAEMRHHLSRVRDNLVVLTHRSARVQ